MRTLIKCCFLILLISLPANAEKKSNPDGILNAPTITILGGFGKGENEYTQWEPYSPVTQKGDLNGTMLGIELLYPTTQSLSLIVRFSASREELENPRNMNFWENKTKVSSYSFVFGVRFFTMGQ